MGIVEGFVGLGVVFFSFGLMSLISFSDRIGTIPNNFQLHFLIITKVTIK